MSGAAIGRRVVEIPPHLKEALDYAEVAALGFCSERKLRQLVSEGKVNRAVLRVGRSIRFLRVALIEELQNLED